MSIVNSPVGGGGGSGNLTTDNTFTGSNTFAEPVSIDGVVLSGGDITQIRTNETDIATNASDITTLFGISGTDEITITRSSGDLTLIDPSSYAKLGIPNASSFTATSFSTGTSANAWTLSGFTSGAPTPDGYITVTVDGTTYRISVEAV